MAEQRKRSRTRPRVEESEPKQRSAKKLVNSGSSSLPAGGIKFKHDGNIEFTVQRSELTPVAQYANVSSLAQMKFDVSGLDLTPLFEVDDWEEEEDGEFVFDYGSLTAEQKQSYDSASSVFRSSSRVLEHHLSEDRELIEESIRMRNAKDKDEAKSRRR